MGGMGVSRVLIARIFFELELVSHGDSGSVEQLSDLLRAGNCLRSAPSPGSLDTAETFRVACAQRNRAAAPMRSLRRYRIKRFERRFPRRAGRRGILRGTLAQNGERRALVRSTTASA